MKILKIVLFLILGFNTSAQIELFQLQWATDSSYVIGALPSGEPIWVHVDSLGIADSIYLQGDSLILLKNGSGQVYKNRIYTGLGSAYDVANPQKYDIYVNTDQTSYWYDGTDWVLFDGDTNPYNEGELTLHDMDTNVVGMRSNTNYFNVKNFVGLNGIQISTNELDSLNIGIDTTALNTRINNFISDSLATIVFPSDSTNIIGGWGLDATESPVNTWNLIADSSQVATQHDISSKVEGSGVATRVAFWDGAKSLSSNSNLYWDNVNSRLGIGTTTPVTSLDVTRNLLTFPVAHFENTNTNGRTVTIKHAAATNGRYTLVLENGANKTSYFDTRGYLGLGATPLYPLHITNIVGISRFENTLTNGDAGFDFLNPSQFWRVAMNAEGGGSNNLHFRNVTNNIYHTMKSSDGWLGLNTLNPQRMLQVNGEVRISDLTTDTPTKLVGASNLGDLNEVNISNGLTLSGSTITANINGTTNHVPKFTSQYGIGNSQIYTVGDTLVGIKTTTPAQTLHVQGTTRITGSDGTATGLMGRDADGDVSAVGLGSGLAITGGTLNYTETGTGDITAVTVSAPITGTSLTGPVPNIAVDTSSTVSLATAYDLTLKENYITPGTTSQYWRGDKTWQTLNTGVTTLAAIGATPNANGATISGSTLNLQPASASFGGVVTTGSQTFAGSKTFDYLGGTEGTNLTTGTSLIMATNAGKLENLYGTVAGYDLPLYNPTGNNWELTKLKTVNGNSLLGSGNVALTTDLSFTGASSPYTLNSNTGNDVTFAAGSGVTLSRSGDQLTIAASGMTSWNLAASGTAGSASITNGSTATITAGSGITATRSGNNITISSAAAGGEQFWTTTTNATSHEIILKDHAGTTNVSALKLIEGNGVEMTTSAGTFSNSNLTINTVGTAVGQMHKEGVTTISFTAVTPQKVALTTSFTSGSGISTSDANDRITVASSGKYMITYSMDVDMNATTFGLTAYVKVSGSTDLSASYKQYNNDTNLTPLSKTFYVDLTAGQYIELWLSNSHTVSTNSLWDPILTIQRVQ